MKKVFSLLMSAAMIMTLCVPAFAVETEESQTDPQNELLEAAREHGNLYTYNEYDMLKSLAAESEEALMEKGYSKDEIADIKDFHENCYDHYIALNELDDQTLELNGYTPEQIETIRNFTGTEEEMVALAAKVTLYSTPSNFKYDGNYSRGILAYGWYWTGIPVLKITDIVAVSWNGWTVQSQSSSIGYYKMSTGEAYTSVSGTFSKDGNGTEGGAHKFDMIYHNEYWAKSGNGSFTLRSDVHAKKDFYYYMEYGHAEIVATPSFSVSLGGASASISFSVGVVGVASDSGSYEFS